MWPVMGKTARVEKAEKKDENQDDKSNIIVQLRRYKQDAA